MSADTSGYTVGQTVLWRGGFGSNPERPARIVGFGEKNGRPLVDLDNGHWAYLTQIRPQHTTAPTGASTN